MMLINLMRKVWTQIDRKYMSVFNINVKEEKRILDDLPFPKDNIERSYFQYLCQISMGSKVIICILNILSLPLFYYLLNKYKNANLHFEDKLVKATFISDGKSENIIPLSLKEFYNNRILKITQEKFLLYEYDINFINIIRKRYYYSYLFLLKNLIKIAKYRAIISQFPNTEAIIVCSEYSYTSSILTLWCNYQNIMHINVMHGEKLFYIRDSFFIFNKCYIWDCYYKKLFIKLRADEDQFFIEVPPALKFDDLLNKDKCYDYTYYLQGLESKEELLKILGLLDELEKNNKLVSIRPHPRYSDSKLLTKIFKNKIDLENLEIVSIEKSILRTKNAISLYSTVLHQAAYNNVNVIIDDVTNRDRFLKLKELEYIFIISGNFKKLSDVLKEFKGYE